MATKDEPSISKPVKSTRKKHHESATSESIYFTKIWWRHEQRIDPGLGLGFESIIALAVGT